MRSIDNTLGIGIVGRTRIVTMLAASMICGSMAISGCAQTRYQNEYRPFFGNEFGLNTHGRKTWFDHLVEVDPGRLDTHLADNYDQAAPQKSRCFRLSITAARISS